MQRETMLNRARGGMEDAYHGVSDRAGQVMHTAEDYTKEAPVTATLVSFGIGMGLGLLLTQLLIPSRPSRQSQWYDPYVGEDRAKYMEDSFSNAAHTAQRYIPRSVRSRLGV